MYHLVLLAKYRKRIFSNRVKKMLITVCEEIEKRYEMNFIEIKMEEDYVYFFIQSVLTYSPLKIVQIVKSITAKKLFILCLEVKIQLLGGEFWTKGYFINTVSKNCDENVIVSYKKNQGKKEESYDEIYKQRMIFE